MISQKKLEILDEIADDYYGLWEFGEWKAEFQDQGSASQVASDINDLLILGLVELFYGTPGRGELVIVPPKEAVKLLQAASSWRERKGAEDPAHYLSTSDSGLAVLRAELPGYGVRRS